MAFTLSSSLYTVALLFALLFSTSIADIVPSNTPLTPENVCNATLDPKFCKSVVPVTGPQNIYNYCRSSFSKALRSAEKYSALIDKYLKQRSTLSNSAILALQDCQLLAGLNIDFLQSISNTINATQTLRTTQADSLESMLSAILTNQQTCLEGLQATASAWKIKDGLYTPLSNATKLYSVSLALFARGYGHTKKKGKFGRARKLLFSDLEAGPHGRLPMRMSNQHRKIYES
ncbi:Plant invertase/pectin methylesterase inhibitor superfamily, partial [Thalictrum thalictroides]